MENKIKVEIEVTNQDIDDIMVTALEGGINYWADKAEVKDGDYKGGEFASDVISRGGTLIISSYEEDFEPVELTKEKLLKGIQIAVNSGGVNIDNGHIATSYIDAGEADCIIQYAVFGELVYS